MYERERGREKERKREMTIFSHARIVENRFHHPLVVLYRRHHLLIWAPLSPTAAADHHHPFHCCCCCCQHFNNCKKIVRDHAGPRRRRPRQNPAKTNIIHHQLRKENLSNILKAGTGNRPLIAGALWKKEVKSFISIALPPVAKMELFGRRRWTNGLAQQTNHECAELYFWLVINTKAYHLGRYRLHLFLLKSSMDVAKLTWSSVWSDWAIFEWTRQQKIFT